MGIFSSPVIGLHIKRQGFALALKRGRTVEPIAHVQWETEWLDERGTFKSSEGVEQFRTAIASLPDHYPVQMALPNPLVRMLGLRTQERTRTRAETEKLLHWHAERLGTPLAASAIDYHWSRGPGKEHRLFAVSAAQTLIDAVSALVEPRCARVVLPGVGYLLRRVPKSGKAVLALDFDEEAFAVAVVDEDGHVRLTRTGWRYPEDRPETLVSEARRLVHAAGDGCEPGAVVASCIPMEWNALTDALARNFHISAEKMVNLAASHGSQGEFARAAMVALA